MIETFALFDTVRMKKPHACGTNAWTVTRVGADIKIRCNACGRIVMMDRQDFLRSARSVTGHAEDTEQ